MWIWFPLHDTNTSHKFISSQARLAHVGTLLISVRSEPGLLLDNV